MKTGSGLLLTHGAGGSRESSALVAIENLLAPFPVERMNFPYRNREGKRPPDRAPVLMAAVTERLAEWCATQDLDQRQVFIGGRSMGGRICSMLAAEGLPCAGLVLIAYPLHPMNRPDNVRREHFPAITVPSLFVSGDRDPFATPDELKRATRSIKGKVSHRTIRGGRHELKGADERVAALVAEWLASPRSRDEPARAAE